MPKHGAPHKGDEKKSTAMPFKKGDKKGDKKEEKAKAFYGWSDFSENSIHIGEDIAEALHIDDKKKPSKTDKNKTKDKEETDTAKPTKK